MDYLNEDDDTHKSKVMLYMNTWGNYNSYGADVENINGGWKTPDEALEWTEQIEKKGEEPFINDVDDYVGLPFEINEYSDISETIETIKDYLELDEYDRNVIGAIIEADGCNYDRALSIYENGDYIFYEDVSNDYDLGYAEVEASGSIIDAVDNDRIESYIDTDRMKETYEDDLRYQFAEDNDINIDDVDEDELEEYIDDVIDEEIRVAIIDSDTDFFDNWFDYEAFGRDLSFDFTYTKYGAINIL